MTPGASAAAGWPEVPGDFFGVAGLLNLVLWFWVGAFALLGLWALLLLLEWLLLRLRRRDPDQVDPGRVRRVRRQRRN